MRQLHKFFFYFKYKRTSQMLECNYTFKSSDFVNVCIFSVDSTYYLNYFEVIVEISQHQYRKNNYDKNHIFFFFSVMYFTCPFVVVCLRRPFPPFISIVSNFLKIFFRFRDKRQNEKCLNGIGNRIKKSNQYTLFKLKFLSIWYSLCVHN